MGVYQILFVFLQLLVLQLIHCEKCTLLIGCLDYNDRRFEDDHGPPGICFAPEKNSSQLNNACCCDRYWGILIPKVRPFEGTGDGVITVDGELSMPGKASVGGTLPVPGTISFKGPVKATGTVSLKANYGCGVSY